jgi:hypothetical protein
MPATPSTRYLTRLRQRCKAGAMCVSLALERSAFPGAKHRPVATRAPVLQSRFRHRISRSSRLARALRNRSTRDRRNTHPGRPSLDGRLCFCSPPFRAVSSAGRAPRLHRGGRRFEPVTAHQPGLSGPEPATVPRLGLGRTTLGSDERRERFDFGNHGSLIAPTPAQRAAGDGIL